MTVLLMKDPVLTRLVTALWDQARMKLRHALLTAYPKIRDLSWIRMLRPNTTKDSEGACKAREIDLAEKVLGKEDEKLA